MAKQDINIGINPNDGTGETLRSAGQKINDNFSELYAIVGAGGEITFVNSITPGPGVSVSTTSGDVVITNTSPYIPSFNAITVSGQSSVAANATQNITLVAGSNVTITTNPSLGQVSFAATQQPADWNAVSGPTRVINKPSIPDPQVQTDWNQSDNGAVDYIKNKPIIPTDVSQLSDSTGLLPDGYLIRSNSQDVLPSETDIVVFSTTDSVTVIKAIIKASGTVGASLDVEGQASELLLVRTYPVIGDPEVFVTASTPISSTGSPLATFSAQWNPTTSSVEITATNLNSGTGDTLHVKVVAIEVLS
jgi:hypothetical protein